MDLSLQAHRTRRDHLRAALDMPSSSGRTKRGLVDGVGSVLHTLFGVATNGQLKRFEAALLEFTGKQLAISHSTRQLASIVNQTRSYLKSVALHQHQMAINVLHINTAITQLTDALESQATRIHRLELLTALDRYMDVLDLATRQYTAQVSLFARQRAGLEQGHLTRDLLSPEQLTGIIRQASTSHQVIDDIEWYYSFLSVSPIWRKTNSLLYKIEIPLVAHRPYLLYKVSAFPVPISNSTYTVKVNVAPHYALDTISGNMFVPHRCLGHKPIVCLTSAEYGPTLLKCARGLITSRPDLIKTCKTTINDQAGQPLISPISLNQHALTTQGEVLTVRCPGKRETHLTLARGTYNITCTDQCTLQGSGYQITCVDRLFLTKSYVLPTVRITAHFEFTSKVDIKVLRLALPQLNQANIQPLTDLDVMTVLEPAVPASTPPIRSRPSLLAIINLFTICSVIVSLTLVYWRHRLCKRSKSQVVVATSTPEALPLAHHTHDTEPAEKPQPTSIWPILPSVGECFNNA